MSHTAQKVIHICLHVAAITATALSLIVIMRFKEVTANYEFYTTHAWLGIATIVAYDANVRLFSRYRLNTTKHSNNAIGSRCFRIVCHFPIWTA